MAKLLRFGLLVAVGLVGWACGDDSGNKATCGPTTCSGCCSSTGKCITATSAEQCGQKGNLCTACGSNETCNKGVCGSSCNASNCPGCCQGNTCQTGDSATACGTNGVACQICDSGGVCSTGKCTAAPCSATTNPNGCCYNGAPFPGDNASLCGKGGAACVVCKSTEQCVNHACTTATTCDAKTCPKGCCKNGSCDTGTGVNACGTNGAACVQCGNGQQCVNQACANVTCNATTCPKGCCDATGNCVGGAAQPACGKGGAACVACTSTQVCTNQACVTATCSASTCPSGCCDKSGNCQPGNAAAACGSGGTTCSTCGTGLECSTSTKSCVCTATSCASGCCQGNTCRTGTENGACGKSGAACQACQSPQQCMNHVCTNDCSYLTCDGCCDTSKVCHPSLNINDTNCGLFGNPCKACTGNSHCDVDWGNCNDDSKCSYSNCTTGCCKDGTCYGGTQDATCGDAAGGVCETCGGTTAPHLYCSSSDGQCVATDASKWDLLVDYAEVKAGVEWDTFLEGGASPEIYVKVKLGTQSNQTNPAASGYTATFNNAFMFSATGADFANNALHYELYDSDTFGDDQISSCDDYVWTSDLKWGWVSFFSCGGNPSDSNFIQVTFRFKVHAP
jgi:hypothetical protein